MKISTKSQYGLRAIVLLARNKDKIISLKDISRKEGIPFDYLEKIISRMEKKQLVGSRKGVKGGYYLKKSPKKIKIGKVIEALEGKMSLVKCIDRSYFCPHGKKCPTKNFWKKLQTSMENTLNSLTLDDLIN